MISAQQNHASNAGTTAASRCSYQNRLSRTTSWEEGTSPPAPPAPLTSSKSQRKRALLHMRGCLINGGTKQPRRWLAKCWERPEPSQLPEPQEMRCLGRPTSANLAGKDDQPNTSPCTRKFRVCPFLASVCGPDGNSLTVPSRRKAETRVVSMANWAPPNSDSPSATTSRRRPSRWLNGPRSKSSTNTFMDTRAPPSRQIPAMALSTGNPRGPNTPATAQTGGGQGSRVDGHTGSYGKTRGGASGDDGGATHGKTGTRTW